MRKQAVLILVAMLVAALPATAGEAVRVLVCVGQCFAVDRNGARVPVARGTELVLEQRIETGPGSYAQLKLGPDNACAIGANARVTFDPRGGERDLVILGQGRIRMIGGELIGRPAAEPVELRTAEGTFVLRSADIEVNTSPGALDKQPGLTLVKVNGGDARIGDFRVSSDATYRLADGKLIDPATRVDHGAQPPPTR